MDQAEVEDLARSLEMWAALADSDHESGASTLAMLRAAAVIRRQAAIIAELGSGADRARKQCAGAID